jgi:hypothetical protein
MEINGDSSALAYVVAGWLPSHNSPSAGHSLAMTNYDKVKVTLQQTIGRPVSLGVKLNLGLKTRFLFSKSNSNSKLCYDRRSVGQSVMVSRTHLGLQTRFLFLSDSCGYVDVGRPLWREDGSVVYNRCWPLPAQSFSGPSPAGLMTIFYCLRFQTPPTCRAWSMYLYPPGTGWPSYTSWHWVPFSSPPRFLVTSLYNLDTDRTENTTSNSSSSVVCLFIA